MKNDIKLIKKIEYEAKYNRIFFAILLGIGLINNLGSVLVVSCAQQLAKKLGNEQLVGFYPMAIKLFSSLSRFLNSKFCIKISYMKRVIFLCIYFLVGYLSLFAILLAKDKSKHFNKTLGFCLSLIPSFIMGSGEALGEVNVLGYLRTFPGDFISGWGSGTGLAGVAGAGITLIFKTLNIETMYLYLYLSPVCIIYFLLFYASTKLHDVAEKSAKNKMLFDDNSAILPDESGTQENRGSEGEVQAMLDDEVEEVATDVKENKAMTCSNFTIAFQLGKKYILNLAAVYYLEYAAYSGFSERVAKFGRVSEKKFKNNLYECFCLCYQTGVMISRSSLPILKYNPYVTIYTLIQIFNFVFLFFEAYFGFVKQWYVLFLILIITGLMGGSSYVSCLYFLMNTSTIESKLRELCLNIGTIFNDIGIVLASVTTLIVDNTIFKEDPQKDKLLRMLF